MSQMSCETRRSTFTMQVDVAECWKYENIENTTQTEGIHLATAMSLRMCHMSVPLYHHGFVIFELCCLFLFFWPWWFRQFSFFLALLSFTGFLTSWLCLCWRVHRNQSHNCKEITNRACTQTKTTNKATTIKATTTKKLLLYYTYIITTVATQTKTTATTTATITRITKQTRTHN